MLAERYARFGLHRLQGQHRPDALHIGRCRELGNDELLGGLEVGRNAGEKVIGIAGQRVALANQRPAPDQLLERPELALGLARQPDQGEQHDAVAEAGGVEGLPGSPGSGRPPPAPAPA